MSMEDRVRWALFYSSMAQTADQPEEVLRATDILDDEPSIAADQLQTLQERRRWALTTANQFNAKQLGLSDLGEIGHIGVFLPESGALSNIASTIEDVIRTHHNLQNNAIRLSFLIPVTPHSMSFMQEPASKGLNL
ncbi:hypothetical protein [Vreelandella azerica]|uniref:hypothetical protein n=1 Tax=Vreelandella azerica TaxID=2732867 RepID=UPI002E2812DD|nr:hypothetical protein [Halomonas azerica]